MSAAEEARRTMREGGDRMEGALGKYARQVLLDDMDAKRPTAEALIARENSLIGEVKADTAGEDGMSEAAKADAADQAGGEVNDSTETQAKHRSSSHPAYKPLADAAEVIYLTSDSPYTLSELKPFHTYVIGGIVDKNRHKGLCYKAAMDKDRQLRAETSSEAYMDPCKIKNIKTAKLPIGEYMAMTSRHVLATNHVVEIMLNWLETNDWGQAFLNVIPKRKGGQLRADKQEEEEEEEEEVRNESSEEDGENAVEDGGEDGGQDDKAREEAGENGTGAAEVADEVVIGDRKELLSPETDASET